MRREDVMKVRRAVKIFTISGIMAITFAGPACKEGGKGKGDQSLLDKPVNELTPGDMNKMIAVIETNHGTIRFKFFPEKAPNHCRNFIKLARDGFYDGLIFHRVIKGFMIQGGCPEGTGRGGPGWNVDAEFSDIPHKKGTVSMARAADPNSAGSQFFICLGRQPHLDRNYTAFGQVIEGLEAVDEIGSLPIDRRDKPVQDAVMKKVYIEMAE
jgi:peptidyl-prolyl cis-trans isomerase B (cyclophilin B)